jgi:undecaprenyl-diphosphatase
VDIIQALVLGIVQGVTEFVPISSSGHLVLMPWLLDWPAPSLAFDTALHWGTMVAILTIFWRDLISLARAWARSLLERNLDQAEARLAWLIIVGTLPAALIAFLWEGLFESLFSLPAWVAALLLVTGTMLALSERLSKRHRSIGDLNWLDSVLIGLAQAMAIAPGISRSGATIAMGLLRGFRREAAARYSFFMAMPIIFGAGLLQLVELFQAGAVGVQLPPLVVGFLAASTSGYLSIRFLLAYLQRGRLYVFASYCWLAGVTSLFLAALAGLERYREASVFVVWLIVLVATFGVPTAISEYRRTRPTRIQRYRSRNYPKWRSTIHKSLLSRGSVRVKFIPRSHREYACERYISEEENTNCIYDPKRARLQLRNYETVHSLWDSYDRAKASLDGVLVTSEKAFEDSVVTFIRCFSDILQLPIRKDKFAYCNLRAFVLDAAVAFEGMVVPGLLPCLFLRGSALWDFAWFSHIWGA